mgnify:CR=1 FL=1
MDDPGSQAFDAAVARFGPSPSSLVTGTSASCWRERATGGRYLGTASSLPSDLPLLPPRVVVLF